MTDDALAEAIRLIRAGKRPEAQLILEPFLQANPQNIPAWMWEAEIFLDDRDKIKVLEICLEHNPDHPQVLKALEILRARTGQPVIPPPAAASVVLESTQPRQTTPAYVTTPKAVLARAEKSAQWEQPLKSVSRPNPKDVPAKPKGKNELSQQYKSRMWSGCGWLMGGIVATILASMVMSQYGYAYIAFTGAIVYGLIRFVSGLFGWLWHMD